MEHPSLSPTLPSDQPGTCSSAKIARHITNLQLPSACSLPTRTKVRAVLRGFTESRTARNSEMGTVAVEQAAQRTQFQHLRAALTEGEQLFRRKASSATRSIWGFYADDDDLGDSGRSLELAKAITSRPQQVTVAVVATTSRQCRGPEKPGDLSTPDEDLPRDSR